MKQALGPNPLERGQSHPAGVRGLKPELEGSEESSKKCRTPQGCVD